MQDYLLEPTKHQNRLGDKITKKKSAEYLHELTASKEDSARFQSLRGKGAGSWLEVIPSSNSLALGPNDFCLAVCLRMGISLGFTSWLEQCEFGRLSDNQDYHLITCKLEEACVISVWLVVGASF